MLVRHADTPRPPLSRAAGRPSPLEGHQPVLRRGAASPVEAPVRAMAAPFVPLSQMFSLERLGVLLEPVPGDPLEAEGILNPGGVLGPDACYHLFPRLVGAGNYSRIGHARLAYNALGRPSAERLGVALEPRPSDPLEARGVEDCRVVYRPDWAASGAPAYAMTYTAYGADSIPRVGLALSDDLTRWHRLGVARWDDSDLLMSRYPNKDAVLLPRPVRAPDGVLSDALIHRPHIPGMPPSIWISYRPVPVPSGPAGSRGVAPTLDGLSGPWAQHTLLAAPRYPWERDRIGAGAPLVETPAGYLLLYHGVRLSPVGRCYQAGALLLDKGQPHRVLARSQRPLFGPETPEERVPNGVPTAVGNVVFPTACYEHDGLIDVFYGAADSRVCTMRLTPNAGTRPQNPPTPQAPQTPDRAA